ncbi:MAG TPA: DUF983 domain-containing protein [Caulobacteraceae bacterium]|nr:DUF983 domain-containing protein [Caulobacteraceae bacterium]
MEPMSETFPHSLAHAVGRGLRGRCPSCGQGALFHRYLKVSPTCGACGHDLDQYPSDDGPAYFTILLVGHLFVLPTLLLPFVWKAPVAIVVPALLIPLAVVTLALLPVVKGGVIGALAKFGVRRRDAAVHTADRLD